MTMNPEEHQNQDPIQVNLATHQRNAGRDYHEFFVPGSIKLLLATKTKEELDRMAIDNSRLFNYRFGFEPPTIVRKQVLTIQQKYDFTDREVRWLKRAGQLQISRKEAKLVPSRLMPITGWIQLVAFSLVCVAMTFQIAFSSNPAWQQALGQLLVSGFWFGGLSIMNTLYLAPWRALERSGALAAA